MKLNFLKGESKNKSVKNDEIKFLESGSKKTIKYF
jgi:hypothetical protein